MNELSDTEKEARQRRTYAPLQAVMHATEFRNDLTQIAVEVVDGGFDPELIYNRLLDAELALINHLEKDIAAIIDMLADGCETWERRMHARRCVRKRKEAL